jgi:hypothetical protein
MMFALGVFVSGLVWLAISVALVRRARRLTERRLLGGIATRRAEFEAERDELRARHAVQMYRLEREVSRILDRATAHRLEADLKEHEVLSVRAELSVREEDFEDLDRRLQLEHELVQELERRNAEAGAALRAAQHALNLESKRRSMTEAALDETSILADQRRLALTALRAENDVLRARLGEPVGPPVSAELLQERLPQTMLPPEPPAEVPELPSGGSVVPLPTRARQMAAESAEQSAAVVAQATRDLQRLAGTGDGDLDKEVWHAAAKSEPRLPAASMPGQGNIGELVALKIATPPAKEAKPKEGVEENAEVRFFEALAEIRALKRAANQAGE